MALADEWLVRFHFRALAFAGAVALILSVASPAAAETIAITSGTASLYWDGSLTSFTISSADSQFMSEYFGAPLAGFSGGTTVDFSTTIPVTNSGNHPLPETYHGQQFQAWVTGSLVITATGLGSSLIQSTNACCCRIQACGPPVSGVRLNS